MLTNNSNKPVESLKSASYFVSTHNIELGRILIEQKNNLFKDVSNIVIKIIFILTNIFFQKIILFLILGIS